MSINPRDYDLDELRRMARKRGGQTNGGDVGDADVDLGSVGPSERSTGGDSSFRAGLYRELLPLEAGSDVEKPYLSAVPEHYAGEHLVFEWLEFLLMHAGYQGATEAIGYYESVGWITEDVDDHLLSLVYIAKLASME